MTRPRQHKSERGHERRLDDTVADSFPASDPPSHSPVTGVGGRRKSKDAAPGKARSPSDQRGHDARPTGLPTWDRHATETAHSWEDEHKS
jgi:hypothetical protein